MILHTTLARFSERSRIAFACALLTTIAGCRSQTTEPPPAAPPPPPPPLASDPATEPTAEQPAAAEPAKPQPIVVKDVGFKTPESVLYVPEEDVYLVSNINGKPFDKDDNGFISKLSPEGKLIDLKWIDASKPEVKLDAPKGMAIAGDILYVADVTMVRTFDRKTGKMLGRIGVPGSTFVNAVAAAPDGTIYVSDSGLKLGKDGGFAPSGTDGVFKIGKRREAQAVSRSKELNGPNGVAAADKGAWVVTFGSDEVYRLDEKGKKQDVTKLPQGQLDGLVRLSDGSLLVSSWAASAVFHGQPGGTFKPLISNVKSPAGMGYDTKRNRVLIPIFQGDAVEIHTLPFTPAAAPPAPPPAAAKPAEPAKPADPKTGQKAQPAQPAQPATTTKQ